MAQCKILKKSLWGGFITIFIAATLNASSPNSTNLPDSSVSQIQNVIDLTVMQAYDEARNVCKNLQSQYPEHPIGYLFEAATLYSQMLDFELYDQKDEFFELTSRVKSLCKGALKEDPKNSWLYFFMGSATGYEAYVNGRDQKLYQAFREGLKSVDLLQKAFAIDSTNYDVYLGVGAYKYYKSKYSRYLSWTPFVKDERDIGVEMIRTAVTKGAFSRAPAINSLLWILIDSKDFSEAIMLADEALAEYPNSRFFLWAKADAAFKKGDFPMAQQAYAHILNTYKKEQKRSYLNELICHARLAEICQKMEDLTVAKEHAQKALAIEIPKSLKDRAGEHRKKARKILKSAS